MIAFRTNFYCFRTKGVEINQRILYEPYLTEANRYYLRRRRECIIPNDR